MNASFSPLQLVHLLLHDVCGLVKRNHHHVLAAHAVLYRHLEDKHSSAPAVHERDETENAFSFWSERKRPLRWTSCSYSVTFLSPSPWSQRSVPLGR